MPKDKGSSCPNLDQVVKDFIQKRKRATEIEEKLLTDIVGKVDIGCLPSLLKQLEKTFDIEFKNLITIAIENQLESEKPTNLVPPQKENAMMRGHLKVIESSFSVDELNYKVNEALNDMKSVYKNDPKMQNMWDKRIKTQHEKVLNTLKRLERTR